jgi:LysM repeat protein
MSTSKNKVKLSPRLQLGVGRTPRSGNLLKYSSFIFLVLSAVLALRAGYMVINHSSEVSGPQVLGAKDAVSENSVFVDYTIKKGDTLFSIAQQYNIEWTTLATLNNLKPPFDLKHGQTIKVPTQ